HIGTGGGLVFQSAVAITDAPSAIGLGGRPDDCPVLAVILPRTFGTKKLAEQWLSTTEVQILQGDWIDPERGRILLKDYVKRWIDERPGLRPRTKELYRWLLRKHIESTSLGGTQVGQLTTPIVRQWRADRIDAGVSEIVAAKAYRLLRAALTTAVEAD